MCNCLCGSCRGYSSLSLSLPMPHCIQWHNNSKNLKYNSCLVARPFHSTTMLEFTLFNYSVARGINIQSRPALVCNYTLCLRIYWVLDVQWLDVNDCCERKKVANRHDRSEMICIQWRASGWFVQCIFNDTHHVTLNNNFSVSKKCAFYREIYAVHINITLKDQIYAEKSRSNLLLLHSMRNFHFQ